MATKGKGTRDPGKTRAPGLALPARVPRRDQVSVTEPRTQPCASLPGAPAPGGRQRCSAAGSSHAAGTVNKDVFPRVAAAAGAGRASAAAGFGISAAAARGRPARGGRALTPPRRRSGP